MKIACQSCQAKYTIADEKVVGRVVKIRCKKCSATIVINGNEATDATAALPPPQEDATVAQAGNAYNYAAQASGGEQWMVNVADGDQRTLGVSAVVVEYRAGVINDETYCWKDGMNDWLPLREIEALASACGVGAGEHPTTQQAFPPAQDPAYAQPSHASAYGAPQASPSGGGLGALFGGGSGGTPFPGNADANGGYGAQAAPAAAPSAARRAGGRAGPGADLFGGVADAGGENDVMTSAPQGAPQMHHGDDAGKLTGQRNENSVLFSLSALTQNAPKDEAPSPQGDGSGLIDIRALSATMAPQTSKNRNHADDIMNLGGGGAFSAALAAPVLAPPPMETSDVGFGGGYGGTQKNNKTIMYLLIGVGVLFVLLIGVVVMALRKPSTTAADNTTGSAEPVGSVAGPVATNDTPATDTAAAPATAAPVDPTPPKPPSGGGGGGVATHRPPSGGGGGAVANNTPPPPPPPPQGFDQAIANAAGTQAAPKPPPQAPVSDSPFDRGAAAAALGAVNVASCKKADGPTGQGHVSVTFSPSGSVTSAIADQPPYSGTPVGGCVAGKFRSARVPPFAGGPVKVGKSFSIN